MTERTMAEAKIDPLHPNGRCRCAGEGQCEWCQRTKTLEELDGITEVLDAAGVPQVTDGPDGRRWTLGLGARVEHVIAELDEARSEVERLRAALAELQAAEKAIETAGSLYQTREPLKDKIVCLIGQRSDLITQVLAHRRELDTAHIRIHELEARAEQAERKLDRVRERAAAAAAEARVRDVVQRAAVLVEMADLFWDRGDPRKRIAASIRALITGAGEGEGASDA